MSQTYTSNGGSSFDTVSADHTPIEVFTINPLYEIDPGHVVRDSAGRRYTVGKCTLIGTRLYSVYLLPLAQEVR